MWYHSSLTYPARILPFSLVMAGFRPEEYRGGRTPHKRSRRVPWWLNPVPGGPTVTRYHTNGTVNDLDGMSHGMHHGITHGVLQGTIHGMKCHRVRGFIRVGVVCSPMGFPTGRHMDYPWDIALEDLWAIQWDHR